MRNLHPLRRLGAAALALAAGVVLSTSANAFSGLSDKQKAHIDEYIHCKILLWTDLDAFNADPVCGGTPAIDIKSMGPGGNGLDPVDECEYDEYEYESRKRECPVPA